MEGKAISFYKEQIAVRDQGQTTCLHHKGRTLDWFCETCHDVMCVNCISSIHKGHDIVPLSDITPNNKREIETFINETEQNQVTQIQQEINSTQECLEKNLSHFESEEEEIQKQGRKLKEDIDVLIAETCSHVKHLKDKNTKLLKSYKTELENKLAELKTRLTECKEIFQSGTDIQVFDVTSRLHTDMTLPKRLPLGTIDFIPNKHPYDALASALGNLALTPSGQSDGDISHEGETSAGMLNEQLTRPSDQAPNEMPFQEKLDSPLPKITVLSESSSPCQICYFRPNIDDGTWVCGLHGKTLKHLTSDGRVQKNIQSPVFVTNISASPSSQNIWACSEEDSSVMEMKSEILVPKFNTKDKPRCLCVTKDDHVLVGMKHSIVKYTPGGSVSLSVKSESTKPLVCSPSKITECPVSENIAVFDGDWLIDGGESKPLIIVMDKHLRELYKYGRYQHDSRAGLLFHPRDVTYDRIGQLVVADHNNDCLHLLTGEGQYLGLLHTNIVKPRGVCVDRQGVLWVVLGGMFTASQVKRLQYTSD